MKWIVYLPEILFTLFCIVFLLVKRKEIRRTIKILSAPPSLIQYLEENTEGIQKTVSFFEEKYGSTADIVAQEYRKEKSDL